jgi:hypothetical protein
MRRCKPTLKNKPHDHFFGEPYGRTLLRASDRDNVKSQLVTALSSRRLTEESYLGGYECRDMLE